MAEEQTDNVTAALQAETEFLSGVETNLDRAEGSVLRGSIWELARDDDVEVLRAALARHRQADHRALLHRMPHNRRLTVRGYERRWWFGRRRTTTVTASVLTPLEHYARPEAGPAPPAGLAELLEHVRRIAGEMSGPRVIGVCAPTGFTAEAKEAAVDLPQVRLVLIEPDGRGGWRVTKVTDDLPEEVVGLFDPEGDTQKIERVRRVLNERSADLLTGGVSVESVARGLGIGEELVARAFAQAAAEEPALRLSRRSGATLLYRGAAVQEERGGMDVFERIKQLFSREGDESQKINVLAERRASMAQRRDRIYEDIAQLESKEAELLGGGKRATSAVVRRRLAAQLAQLRKDIGRHNASAKMLNQQIDIISTNIHNLTLIRQGQTAELPSTEELTENAVRAEEMLETLKSDADLVGSLETGLHDSMTSDEELEILREFEAAETTAEGASVGESASAPPAHTPPEAAPAEETPAADVPPAKRAKHPGEPAGPEAS